MLHYQALYPGHRKQISVEACQRMWECQLNLSSSSDDKYLNVSQVLSA